MRLLIWPSFGSDFQSAPALEVPMSPARNVPTPRLGASLWFDAT